MINELKTMPAKWGNLCTGFLQPLSTYSSIICNVASLISPFQDLAQGLRDLLNYEGDVEDDFGLTYQVKGTY